MQTILSRSTSSPARISRPTFPIANPPSIPGVPSRARVFLRAFFRAVTVISPALAADLALGLFTVPWRGILRTGERALLESSTKVRLRCEKFDLQTYTWGDAGPRVLVLHGWSSRAARMGNLIETLVKSGYRVVAFDAPGHGLSTGVRSNLQLYREAIRKVLTWCGDVQAVLGHSLGARAAMLVLGSIPRTSVRALGVLAAPRDVRYMLEQFKLVLNLRDDVCRLLERRVAHFFGAPPDVHRRSEVRRLRMPVLIVHDEQDGVVPAGHAISLARQFPDARLVMTRNLNHCGVVRDPRVMQSLLSFLEEQCVESTAGGVIDR